MLIRILLLLLSAFFLSWGADNSIDLSQCGITRDCYLRDFCVDGTNANMLSILDKGKKPKNDFCDAIIQIRYYSSSTFRVIMQVNVSDSNKIAENSEISLKQDEVQFKCTKTGPDVNRAIFNIRDLVFQWDKNLAFCAFTITTTDETAIMEKVVAIKTYPTMEFKLGSSPNTQLVSLKVKGDTAWNFWIVNSEVRCNPLVITSMDSASSVFREDTIDISAPPPINCVSSNKSLIITRENAQPTFLQIKESLICAEKTIWKYEQNSTLIEIPSPETFNAVCGERFCSLCNEPDHINTPGCSEPTITDTSEGCKIRTCPDSTWLLDGIVQYGVLECKQDADNKRKSAWYLKTSNDSLKVTKAACFDRNICWKRQEFKDDCYDRETHDCKEYAKKEPVERITCLPGYQLSWWLTGGKLVNASALTCDVSSGKYRDNSSTELLHDVNVICWKMGNETNSPPAAAKSNIGLIGGGIGAFLLLVAIGVVVLILIRRKRKKRKHYNRTSKVDTDSLPIPKIEVHKPEDDIGRKRAKLAKRRPWLKRDRNLKEITPCAEALGRIDNAIFTNYVMQEFTQYSFENRKRVFYNATTFDKYADTDDLDYLVEGGDLARFWQLFKMCETSNLDCIYTWEMFFRVIKMLHGKMLKTGIERDHPDPLNPTKEAKFNERLRKRMVEFALPIYKELGCKMREGEHESDTWMRFFVLRVLKWVEQIGKEAGDSKEYVTTDLEKAAKAASNIHTMEAPMCAVSVMNMLLVYKKSENDDKEKEEEKKKDFDFLKERVWTKFVVNNEGAYGDARDKFGTPRQHVLFAFGAAADAEFVLNMMKEMYLADPFGPAAFTPHDFYWAFKGITEFFDNFDLAIFLLTKLTPKKISSVRAIQLSMKYPNLDSNALAEIRRDWMQVTVDTLCMLGECATEYDRYCEVAERGDRYFNFCKDLPNNPNNLRESRTALFYEIQIGKRSGNLYLRFDADAQHKKQRVKLYEDFDEALKAIEEVMVHKTTETMMKEAEEEWKEKQEMKKEEKAQRKKDRQLKKQRAEEKKKEEAERKQQEEEVKRYAEEQKKKEEEERKKEEEDRKKEEEEEKKNGGKPKEEEVKLTLKI